MIELSSINSKEEPEGFKSLRKIPKADTRGFILGYSGFRHSLLSMSIQRILNLTILYFFYMIASTYEGGDDLRVSHGPASNHNLSKNEYFKTVMVIFPLINLTVGIDNFIIFAMRKNHRFFLATSVFNLLLVPLDYLQCYNYWDFDYEKDKNGEFVVTTLVKFARVLCIIFPIVTLCVMVCTAEKNLQLEKRSWHVVLNKLPFIWAPIILNSYLIRLLTTYYITV